MKRYLLYSLSVFSGIMLISWIDSVTDFRNGVSAVNLNTFLTPGLHQAADAEKCDSIITLKSIRSIKIGPNRPGSIRKLN